MNNSPRLQRLLQTAVAHHQAGRLALARPLYEELRRAAPHAFDVLHLSGLLALQENRPADALPLLIRATRANPRSALAAMRLGAALNALHRPTEAELHLRRAATLDRDLPETWGHLTATLRLLRRLPEARAACESQVRLAPGSIAARHTLATLVVDTEGMSASIPYWREITTLAPADAHAWCNLGLALVTDGQLTEGTAALDRTLQLAPDLHQARVGRAFALQSAHRIPEAIDAYTEALDRNPSLPDAASARLLCLNYLDDFSPEDLFAAHRDYARHLPPAQNLKSQISNSLASAAPTARLRVAFLSPDLRTHSVAFFLEPLLRHLDPARFEVVLYHDHFRVDETSRRLQSLAALWRNFVGLSHDAVETRIRADAPHILVDLAGHTGFNRLPLFARRLAPVQLSYLGYPNTSGLTEIDFRFTDAIADPPGSADKLHTEKLIRFAPTAWTWQSPPDAPQLPPASSPAAGARVPISFGSFNNAAKLSDSTLATWSRLLAIVPDSRLVLKGHGLDDPAVLDHFIPRLAENHIDPARVTLLRRTPTTADHLSAYARIDIALDPFPYNGTTTTCEALWMGRPLITLAGDRHAARVGSSLLTAIGRPEWIATSADDYISRAAALASDPATLAAVSAGLRDQLRASPLLDHAAQAARFATALESCWREKSTSAPSRSAPAGDLHHAA